MALDTYKVKEFYNNVSDVWNNTAWYKYSQKVITTYINKLNIKNDDKILNAGSAGNSYGIISNNMIHLDIAENKLKGIKNACIGSIEQIPFEDNCFDIIICVGSVLNYCDAMQSISELMRVLKPNGQLLLEFESSWGFEYLHKKSYKKHATIIETYYIENQHKQWIFSPEYIKKIIKAEQGIIINETGFHLITGLIARYAKSDDTCIKFACFDKLLRYVPFINKHYSNIIYMIKKLG